MYSILLSPAGGLALYRPFWLEIYLSPRHGADERRRACAHSSKLCVILELSRIKSRAFWGKIHNFILQIQNKWTKIQFKRLKCVKSTHLKGRHTQYPTPPVTPELVTWSFDPKQQRRPRGSPPNSISSSSSSQWSLSVRGAHTRPSEVKQRIGGWQHWPESPHLR